MYLNSDLDLTNFFFFLLDNSGICTTYSELLIYNVHYSSSLATVTNLNRLFALQVDFSRIYKEKVLKFCNMWNELTKGNNLKVPPLFKKRKRCTIHVNIYAYH